MKKMSEQSELLLLLKELVNKVENLEKAVYDKDNLLMKSGLVVVNTPTPSMSVGESAIESDNIAKMEWNDINEMVSRIEGGY
jgi:hypothetical protein